MTSDDPIYIDQLLRQLQVTGNAVAVRYRDSHVTGDELRAMIFRHARVLRGLGVGPGALLALYAPNRPEAIAIRYAAHVLGAATIYLSRPASEAGRRAFLEQMAPDLLVVFAETEQSLVPEMNVPFATIGFDRAGSRARLDGLAASASPDPIAVLARADDLGVIASSGGSTGVPKGSCRSFAAYTALVSAPSVRDRVQLINGPLAYLSQVLVDNTLLGGGCVVFSDSQEPADTLATIEAERITDIFLVEPQLFELMDDPTLGTRDLSSLRSLTHIGASAPPCLRLRARKRLGPILNYAYGASEMGLVSVLGSAQHDEARPQLFASAGHVRPGVEIRFRRADGRLASPGEGGSIEVRSSALATGYRNNAELTARAFQQGWYCTGDLGRLDEDGLLYILGRAVDAQRIDEHLVMPAEIEDTLCRQPSTRYAVVVRDAVAPLTIAAVVPWPGLAIDEFGCRQAVMARFGSALAGSIIVVPVERIPLTEQGKPDRAAIKELARRSSAA